MPLELRKPKKSQKDNYKATNVDSTVEFYKATSVVTKNHSLIVNSFLMYSSLLFSSSWTYSNCGGSKWPTLQKMPLKLRKSKKTSTNYEYSDISPELRVALIYTVEFYRATSVDTKKAQSDH